MSSYPIVKKHRKFILSFIHLSPSHVWFSQGLLLDVALKTKWKSCKNRIVPVFDNCQIKTHTLKNVLLKMYFTIQACDQKEDLVLWTPIIEYYTWRLHGHTFWKERKARTLKALYHCLQPRHKLSFWTTRKVSWSSFVFEMCWVPWFNKGSLVWESRNHSPWLVGATKLHSSPWWCIEKNHGELTSWWSVPGLVNSFIFSRLSHWCGLFNHVFVSERRKQCTCNDWWMVWKLNEKKSKGSRVLSWWEKGEGRGFKTWMLEHVKETCFRMQPAWFLRERG